MGAKVGIDAKIYVAATGQSGTFNEVKNARNVTLNLGRSEADVSSRGGGGWKTVAAGLKEVSIEFEIIDDPSDTTFATIRDAWLNGSKIGLQVLDGDLTENGSQGLKADCVITGFNRDEPLEDALTYKVTAKPTHSETPPSWVTITSP